MKRHPSLVPYSSDHHQILVLAQMLKKKSPAYKGLPSDVTGKKQYALEKYESLVKDHEAREEKRLFPNIRNRTREIDILIDKLEQEHLSINIAFGKMKESDFGVDEMDQLGYLIEEHVRTEERNLFELVQNSFSAKELEALSID